MSKLYNEILDAISAATEEHPDVVIARALLLYCGADGTPAKGMRTIVRKHIAKLESIGETYDFSDLKEDKEAADTTPEYRAYDPAKNAGNMRKAAQADVVRQAILERMESGQWYRISELHGFVPDIPYKRLQKHVQRLKKNHLLESEGVRPMFYRKVEL